MRNTKYTKALDFVIKKILGNKRLRARIKYIAVLGSYRECEVIENYSDLDILCIVKSDKYGVIKSVDIELLKKVASQASADFNIKISLLAHTEFDFTEYVDFNYLIHYSWGEVVCGDQKQFASLFKSILDNKNVTKESRRALMYYNIIHARFNLIRKYVSFNQNNTLDYRKDITKLFIDNILEICGWRLVYDDVFLDKKLKIVSIFQKKYKGIKYGFVPRSAYELRKNWNSVDFNSKKIDRFLDDSILFIQSVVEELYERYR